MTRFLVIVFCILFSMAAMSKDVSKDKSKHLSTHKIQTSKKIANTKVVRKKLPLLTVAQYKKLSTNNRKLYVRYMRAAWVSFEKNYVLSQKMPVVWFQSLLWESAYAAERKCVIGGVVLDTVSNKCPTRNNPCEGQPNSFKCGEIFASVCVSREPISDLSKRCSDEAGAIPSPEEFEKLSLKIKGDYDALCASGPIQSNTSDGCTFLAQRLSGAAVVTAGVKNTYSTPEVPFVDISDQLAAKYGISDPNCPNDLDKDFETAAVRQLAIPKFSFEENRFCLFERNQKYLNEMTRSGCGSPNYAADKMLFTSRIEFMDNDKDNVFQDMIIENMTRDTAEESAGLSSYSYTVQYLKPITKDGVNTFERSSRKIQRKVYNTSSCNNNAVSTCAIDQYCNGQNKCESTVLVVPNADSDYSGTKDVVRNIRIYNTQRKNIFPEPSISRASVSIFKSSFDKMMDNRVMVAQNCELSKALTTSGYYNSLAPMPKSDRIFNTNDGSQ